MSNWNDWNMITREELDYIIDKTAKDVRDTCNECNKKEADDLHTALFDHLEKIKEIAAQFDKRIEARQEAERVAELAVREEVLLETDDGQKIKFSAPYGFDSPSSKGSTIYCFDMYDLHLEGGKIEAAKTYLIGGVYRDLSPEELEVCNSLMQRM